MTTQTREDIDSLEAVCRIATPIINRLKASGELTAKSTVDLFDAEGGVLKLHLWALTEISQRQEGKP